MTPYPRHGPVVTWQNEGEPKRESKRCVCGLAWPHPCTGMARAWDQGRFAAGDYYRRIEDADAAGQYVHIPKPKNPYGQCECEGADGVTTPKCPACLAAPIEDWAQYFEHFGEHVGDPELTGELVAQLLRGPRPFGVMGNTE